jgi:hypothetical protein
MATRKRPSASASAIAATKPSSSTKSGEIPHRIFAQVSPKSIGGTSLFDAEQYLRAETIGYFTSETDVIRRALSRLEDAGFEILQANTVAINIAGTQKNYERAFGVALQAEERECLKVVGGNDNHATFIDVKDTPMSGLIDTKGGPMGDLVEGVALEERRYPFAASSFAPLKSYWHLRVPADVSLACNADRAHRGGTTGKGVKVAMCDSGHFAHPFFASRGYRVSPVVLGPGAANPTKD